MSPQDIQKMAAQFGRNYDDVKNSDGYGNQFLDKISGPANMLSKLKGLAQMMPDPAQVAAVAGSAGFVPASVLPYLYGSSLVGKMNTGYKNQADTMKELRLMNAAERRISYNNAWGDSGARTAYGTNQLGNSIGQMALAAKALGTAGVINDFIPNNHILTAMGAMQGIKGAGTITAGLSGGVAGLGGHVSGIHGSLAGLDPTMLGVASLIAMNMAGGKLNTALLNGATGKLQNFKVNTSFTPHIASQLEMDYSSMPVISSQIKMLTHMNQLSPGDALQANILMMIESHTSVLAPILEELKNSRLKKDYQGGNAGQNVASDFFGEDGMMSLNDQGKGYKKNPNIFQRAFKQYAKFGTNLASLNPFTQIGNTLSGHSSVALFNEFNRKEKIQDADQRFGNKFSISTSMVRVIHTSSAEVLNQAESFEAKQIAILSGMYELNRFQAHELLSIRRDGLGVNRPGHTGELLKERLADEDQPFDELGTLIDEMLGFIPLWHTISGSAKMVISATGGLIDIASGNDNIFSNMFRDLSNSITETFNGFDANEGSVRNTIGATVLSDSDLMAKYLSGDYIDQMQDLLEYNRKQTHYLEYLAKAESSRNTRKLINLGSGSRKTMDVFSGKLMTDAELTDRDNAIGEKLAEQLTQVAPQGLMGTLFSAFMSESSQKRRVQSYNIKNYEWAKDLKRQFGGTQGFRNVATFAEGGHTGKADGTMPKDHTGEEIAGIVHKEELVLNKEQLKDKRTKKFAAKMGISLPGQPATSGQMADIAQAETLEQDANTATIKSGGLLENSVSFLKKIYEELLEANEREDKKNKGDQENIFGDKNPFSWLDKMIEALLIGGPIAAVVSGLGLAKLLPQVAKAGNWAKGKVGGLFSTIRNQIAGTAVGNAVGVQGPALPPGMSVMDKAKGGLQATGKAATKFLGKGSAATIGLGAAIDYMLIDDVDEEGNIRSVGDKLNIVWNDMKDNTGMLLGGLIGAGLGTMIPVPGATLVGGIAGSFVGQKVQDKVEDWIDSYSYATPEGEIPSTARKIGRIVGDNKYAILGAGLGASVGVLFGGVGAIPGAMIGGLIGYASEGLVTNVKEWVDKIDFTGKAQKGVDNISSLPGAKQGIAVANYLFGDSPFAGLVGGLFGAIIGAPINLLSSGITAAAGFFSNPSAVLTAGWEWIKESMSDIGNWFNKVREWGVNGFKSIAGDVAEGIDEESGPEDKKINKNRYKMFKDAWGSNNIGAFRNIRETSEINGNYKLAQIQEKTGNMLAYGNYQFDIQSGSMANYIKNHPTIKKGGLGSLDLEAQTLIKKIYENKSLTPEETEKFKKNSGILGLFGKDQQDKYWNENYLKPALKNKNVKKWYEEESDNEANNGLKQWFTSNVNYGPKILKPLMNDVLKDGTIEPKEVLDLKNKFAVEMKKYLALHHPGSNYSAGDIDQILYENIKKLDNKTPVYGKPVNPKTSNEKLIQQNEAQAKENKELEKLKAEQAKENKANQDAMYHELALSNKYAEAQLAYTEALTNETMKANKIKEFDIIWNSYVQKKYEPTSTLGALGF